MLLAWLYRLRGEYQVAMTTAEARFFEWTVPVTILIFWLCHLTHLPPWLSAISALIIFGGISIGHSFAQNARWTQYPQMALVCYTRLAASFLPLQIAAAWYHMTLYPLWIAPVALFFISWGACALSYTPIFQTRTLRIFNFVWCAPYGSNWEEWLIGLSYDAVFLSLFIFYIWG